MRPRVDLLVVGAGFAGAVCARELAEAGAEVLVVDRRDHIGGNAYDRLDPHGVLVHDYGPHIFHTNASRIFDYVGQFTEWRFYEHRVLAAVDGKYVPLPLNRTSLNLLYGFDLDEAAAADYLEGVREPRNPARNSEDVVLNAVGRDLCDKIYRGYTQKQWGIDLAALAPSVAARIPVRTNDDDRYFTDAYQAVPLHGYSRLFRNLLDHPRIKVEVRTAYSTINERVARRHTVYTGPVDELCGYRFGRLPYRSLRFEFEYREGVKHVLPAPAVTYPSASVPYTREAEYKQITGQAHSGSTTSREFPSADGDPYYPIPNAKATESFGAYRTAVSEMSDFTFVGRLAEYKYYNMDQAVAASLKAADRVRARLYG